VGLPDEKYGEVVAAFVVRKKEDGIGADEIRAWVRERLSSHLGESSILWSCARHPVWFLLLCCVLVDDV